MTIAIEVATNMTETETETETESMTDMEGMTVLLHQYRTADQTDVTVAILLILHLEEVPDDKKN
jgi:hypothetical protein